MRKFLSRIKEVRQHISASAVLAAIVVLVATVFPRLMVIGGLPTTDEGIYAYYAQFMHANLAAGRGLPDAGMLSFYPLLVSWVFGFGANHMILLRLADMLVAVAASWLLCRVIERESGSLMGGALISLVFLFTMNQPIFIQNGFKNSIFAAYVPLFLALRLGQNATDEAHKNWWLAGALVALAVLLRETFFPFPIVGALAIMISHGRRAFMRFAVGATVTGFFIMLGIVAARGGIAHLIDAYRILGVVYAPFTDHRWHFITNGILSANEAAVALIFGGLSIVAIVVDFFTRNRPVSLGRFAFWLSVALVPLLEPISKMGFPYHFAVCLPGVAGLAALGWKSAAAGRGAKAKLCLTMVAAVGVLLLLPKIIPLANYWPSTRNTLQSVSTGAWPGNATEQSNYLLAADAIRKAVPPNGTLSISGTMYALYPLTGLLPPSHDLSNLNFTMIKFDLDGTRFKQALLACPPDVLMTTTRDLPGTDTLAKAVVDSGLYEQVAIIPVAPEKMYGSFGGTVYRRVNQIQKPCHSENAP